MRGTVLVVGAAGGIGSALLDRFSRTGAPVVGADLPGTGAQEVVDVRDAASVDALVERVEDVHGPVEVLVSATGVLRSGDVLTSDPADLDLLLAVNTVGVARTLRAVAARMVPRGRGVIVTISSNAAGVPRAGMAAYAASKAAVTAFTKSFGLELAAHGVRCNVVAPGTTRTAMLERTGEDVERAVARAVAGDPGRYKTGIPLQRVAEPGDIADAVVFLASDAARHITLQEIYVDGGATLR
ncbi:SDR family oxidoreductase [Kineococcus sp. SYSU DK001]|uniref:SDR family oxidoreductase n=1 Tax=Kineococcus sp. SYSU DK001 TaxID=3383122 RepID=UPI003D7C7E7D